MLSEVLLFNHVPRDCSGQGRQAIPVGPTQGDACGHGNLQIYKRRNTWINFASVGPASYLHRVNIQFDSDMNVRFHEPFDANAYRTLKEKSAKGKATRAAERHFVSPRVAGRFTTFSAKGTEIVNSGAESSTADRQRLSEELTPNPTAITAQRSESNPATEGPALPIRAKTPTS